MHDLSADDRDYKTPICCWKSSRALLGRTDTRHCPGAYAEGERAGVICRCMMSILFQASVTASEGSCCAGQMSGRAKPGPVLPHFSDVDHVLPPMAWGRLGQPSRPPPTPEGVHPFFVLEIPTTSCVRMPPAALIGAHARRLCTHKHSASVEDNTYCLR